MENEAHREQHATCPAHNARRVSPAPAWGHAGTRTMLLEVWHRGCTEQCHGRNLAKNHGLDGNSSGGILDLSGVPGGE